MNHEAIRPLRADELKTAASTLALAFDEDPFFRYMMPEARRRSAWLRWFHRRALTECNHVAGAFTLDAPEIGSIGLYPPGAWPPKLGAVIGSFPFPPFPFLFPPHRLLTIGLRVEDQMHKLHPKGDHVYIYVIGVHPSQKGRGFGGALLRHAQTIARDANVILHLETSKEENVSFYRRFGFDVRSTIEVGDAPPIWIMTTS